MQTVVVVGAKKALHVRPLVAGTGAGLASSTWVRRGSRGCCWHGPATLPQPEARAKGSVAVGAWEARTNEGSKDSGAEQNAVNPPPSRTLLVTTKLKLFLLLRSKKKIVLFLRTARLPLVQLNCPDSRADGSSAEKRQSGWVQQQTKLAY